MSANNWRFCPQCLADANAERLEKLAAAEVSYGTVTPAAYLELVQEANRTVKPTETFLENFQVGTDDAGTFSVSYCGICNLCGFRYKYKHEEQVLMDVAARRIEAVHRIVRRVRPWGDDDSPDLVYEDLMRLMGERIDDDVAAEARWKEFWGDGAHAPANAHRKFIRMVWEGEEAAVERATRLVCLWLMGPPDGRQEEKQ